jgi:hypothetical protein
METEVRKVLFELQHLLHIHGDNTAMHQLQGRES